MRLSDFKFKLPEELIAQFPSRFRDEARMLVLHAKTGEIEHKLVSDLAAYFDDNLGGLVSAHLLAVYLIIGLGVQAAVFLLHVLIVIFVLCKHSLLAVLQRGQLVGTVGHCGL